METEKRLIDLWGVNMNEVDTSDCTDVEDILSAVITYLSEQPTVDAVEVVHGHWIPVPSSDMMTGKAYKCSECGKMRYGSYMPNYCPNCGAKMDLRKENE